MAVSSERRTLALFPITSKVKVGGRMIDIEGILMIKRQNCMRVELSILWINFLPEFPTPMNFIKVPFVLFRIFFPWWVMNFELWWLVLLISIFLNFQVCKEQFYIKKWQRLIQVRWSLLWFFSMRSSSGEPQSSNTL